MLLGRVGLWVLKSPFTKHSTKGLTGKIVSAAFMKTLVSKGQDVSNNVYAPVDATSLYNRDLSNNQIIITINVGGKLYAIPDNYISNLYDGQTSVRYHYMTVKVGMLPVDYDMTGASAQLAKSVSEVTGVNVLPKDIYVGVSDKDGVILSDMEAQYADLKRLTSIEDNESVYTTLDRTLAEKANLEENYNAVLTSYDKLLKSTSS